MPIEEEVFLTRLNAVTAQAEKVTAADKGALLRTSTRFILLNSFITDMGDDDPDDPRYRDYHERWQTAYEKITGNKLYPDTPTKQTRAGRETGGGTDGGISPPGIPVMYQALRL